MTIITNDSVNNEKVIPLFEPPKVEDKCSFCGKPKLVVRKLIDNGGTGKNRKCICDACIILATIRLKESMGSN